MAMPEGGEVGAARQGAAILDTQQGVSRALITQEEVEKDSEHYAHWVPVTEVSDDDYRSFCWPCEPLEEADEPGGAGKKG